MEQKDPYVAQLENELSQRTAQVNELSSQASSNIFSASQESNLIQWQLELDNILESIEHLLKGSIIKEDDEGNVIYVEPTDKTLIVLNDYGVQLIMSTLKMVLNRNTILSNYSPDRIKEILKNLGHEIRKVIFINYEKMGMDTMQKKSRANLLVLTILYSIESAYNRSLLGGERESLRSARVVHQSVHGSVGGGYTPQQQPVIKHRGGFLNPRNWRM